MPPQTRSMTWAERLTAPQPIPCNLLCCSEFARYQDARILTFPVQSNPIHPIFAREQFDPRVDYAALEPTLRLASRYLDMPSAMHRIAVMSWGDTRVMLSGNQGWMSVDLAEVRSLRTLDGELYPIAVSRFATEDMQTVSTSMRDRVDRLLCDAKAMVSFQFRDSGSRTVAATHEDLPCGLYQIFPAGQKSVVHLPSNLYQTILRYRNCPNPQDVEVLLMSHFTLATTLLHELAHVLSNATEGCHPWECFYQDCAIAENGFGLEAAVFGGLLQVMPDAFARRRKEYCSRGRGRGYSREPLLSCAWPSGVHQGLYRHRKMQSRVVHRLCTSQVRRVRRSFVWSLFTDEFWEREGAAGPEGPLDVPTVGEPWLFRWDGGKNMALPWISSQEYHDAVGRFGGT